jgi:uncharacterized repeat protein (TIGR01451 family)
MSASSAGIAGAGGVLNVTQWNAPFRANVLVLMQDPWDGVYKPMMDVVSVSNNLRPMSDSAAVSSVDGAFWYTAPQSDLQVVVDDGRSTVVPGTPNAYTITVTNAGPTCDITAVVADTFPAAFTGVTWTCSVLTLGSPGSTSCPAGGSGNINDAVNVGTGGQVRFVASGTVHPAATGTLSNTATVSPPGGTSDPNGSNNVSTDVDTLTPQVDVSVTKTDGQTTAIPGTSVTYTIVAANSGPSEVSGLLVQDSFPSAVTSANWTCAGSGGGACGSSPGSGNISQLVSLPVGGSVTYTVNAAINPAATGSLVNTANASVPGGVTETNPSNNSATDTDTLTPVNNTSANAKDVLIGSTSTDTIGPAPNDHNWFRFGVQTGRSYCVEVDNGKTDVSVRDSVLSVYRPDGSTLIGGNNDIADEPGGPLLSRVCYIANVSEDNLADVTSGAGGTAGGFRVRVVETTLFSPWLGPLFSGSGFESFILMKNTTGAAHNVTVTLTGSNSAFVGTLSNAAPANGSFNIQVSAAPPVGFGLSGTSASVIIAHDGPPGALIANVTTLNFGSGVSYDTPAVSRQDYRK